MQTVAASHAWRSCTNADAIVFSWQTQVLRLFVCSLQPYFTWRHLNAIFKKRLQEEGDVDSTQSHLSLWTASSFPGPSRAQWGALTRGGFQSACWGSKVHPRSTSAFSPLFLLDTPWQFTATLILHNKTWLMDSLTRKQESSCFLILQRLFHLSYL